MQTRSVAPDEQDGRSDFDFLIGKWKVTHSRLQRRLEDDTAWDVFDGTCDMRTMLGGLGNMDDNLIQLPDGAYRAASIRAFNPDTRLWSIWWLDARKPDIDAPVRGSFADGIGTFLGEDSFKGKSILVRFIWSEIKENTARWEQAFSPDNGENWETNWIMEFERSK